MTPAIQISAAALSNNTVKLPSNSNMPRGSIINTPQVSVSSPTVSQLRKLNENLTQVSPERAAREKQQQELTQKKQYDALKALVAQQAQQDRKMATLREQQTQSKATKKIQELQIGIWFW